MEAWREESLNDLINVNLVDDLFVRVSNAASSLGFDYCAYGIRLPLPVSNPKVVMFNNYPLEWQKEYSRNNYLSVDPTVQHGVRSSVPILWGRDEFAPVIDLWENANAHGLKHGWAQSARDSRGVIGMLTLARGAEQLTLQELESKESKMHWLVQMAYAGFSKLVTMQHLPESQAQLTPREIEILRWTADGKTAYEIGQISGISAATVNFHINNAVNKLGAVNKTQAVVKAALLGFIT
ncbi:MAG: LuxR family transcriptional regulator [Paucimonas sp.]|jgi:DNA-binding CsgD family transcriptional regulator|nr:LuxR family transcriptional regulator [Paucimonas sp.]